MDARRDAGDWTAVSFDDSTWEKAVAIDGKLWGPLTARRTPLLRETTIESLCLIQEKNGVAIQNLSDKPLLEKRLPLELAAGSQIVIDAGQFVQAYVEIGMDADEGSQLELEYAQSFFSTGNKPEGGRSGVSRYITRKGRQTFVSGDTFGFKYLVVRCASGRIAVSSVKVVNRLYPFDVVGRFESNDKLLNDIWRMGVRTILTCSEDAYVDCASRERTEWLGDGVIGEYPITRLAFAGPGPDGKPRWSDPRLFGSMLRHIGQSVQPDGRVKAHHPSNRWDIHGFIDDYACLWVRGVRMWHDNTGDLALVREVWPAVEAQLQWFLDRRTERGLVKGREFVFPGNPLCYQVCEGATLNAAVAGALRDAATLAGALGNRDRQKQYADAAQSLGKAINTHLWDDKNGTYYGSVKDGKPTPPTVHAAGISLFFAVVPADRRGRVQEWFLANFDREDCGPYQYAYFSETLARIDSADADFKALDAHPLALGPQWFDPSPARPGKGLGPGENCHNMGSSPTIYLSRHVLGVEVDGPVAKPSAGNQASLGRSEDG